MTLKPTSPLRRSNPFLVTICVALMGVVGSAAIWDLLSYHDQRNRRAEFLALATERATAIQREFSEDVELLYSISAFFSGSPKVDADGFQVFTQRLIDRHRSVLAFEWAPRVPRAERAHFESRLSQAGNYVTISEIGKARQLKTAGLRDYYYPVEYLVQPRNRKSSTLGFDHGSDPPRWEAMQQSCSLRRAVVSERLDLFRVEGTEADRKGLLVALPVFDASDGSHDDAEHLRGFVFGLFRIADVIDRALGDLTNNDLSFALVDSTTPTDPHVLHARLAEGDSKSVREFISSQDGSQVSLPFAVANRNWRLVVSPPNTSKVFGSAAAKSAQQEWSSTPLVVLLSGLLATAALSVATFLVLERSARIQRLVDHRTAELSEANRQLTIGEAQQKLVADALEARAAELDRTNRVLAEKNQELDEFTYVASHDLQEPVRKLVAFSGLLEQDLGDQISEKAQRDLGFIVDAAQRMRQLVRDLLELSRAGRSAVRAEDTCLDMCLDRALSSLAMRVEETNATIVRDELPVVTGDATLLTQLFQNLVGNALKFVEDDAPLIHITAERSEGKWTIGVKDNGIGIKPEYCQQIFKPFQRLHSRAEYSGTGIGLAICKKSVQRLGGEIFVESQLGEGAHFMFRLPVQSKEAIANKLTSEGQFSSDELPPPTELDVHALANAL